MSLTPRFHILIPAQEVIGILLPPNLIAQFFVLPSAFRLPTALLTISNSSIRLKKLPARHTPLPIKQFKLFHEKKFNGKMKKINLRRDLDPAKPISQTKKQTPLQNKKPPDPTLLYLASLILFPT
jgi:hypothetical protein